MTSTGMYVCSVTKRQKNLINSIVSRTTNVHIIHIPQQEKDAGMMNLLNNDCVVHVNLYCISVLLLTQLQILPKFSASATRIDFATGGAAAMIPRILPPPTSTQSIWHKLQ